MNQYQATPADTNPRLVLGFGNTTERQIRSALVAISDLLTA